MTEEKPKAAIDVSGLHEELAAAGLPVKGVDSNGRITWAISPSGQQVASAAQITAQHRGKPARAEQRAEVGITESAMVEALWEKVFLGTDTKAQILLQKMAALETIE
jgi:hypothetical protein